MTREIPARPARKDNRASAALRRFADELDSQSRVLVDNSPPAGPGAAGMWRSSAGAKTQRAARGIARAAPPGSRRFRYVRRSFRAAAILASEGPVGFVKAVARARRALVGEERLQADYDEWRRRHEPTAAQLDAMRDESRTWAARPLISVLMPTYNSRPEWLRPALDSVLAQTYDRWELCISDDASPDLDVVAMLDEYAARDQRIRLVKRAENGGIAAATASALELATGEFVALLDHDDELRPHALHRVVELVREAPDTDVVYSDEDLLLEDGTYGRPFFKPDFSPDFLLSNNYMCHFLVVRRALVEDVGGFRSGFDGAQDHDLLLRATERARKVGHVTDILYSWRQVPGSVAMASDAKMYAYESGKRAVEDALRRRGLVGTVTLGEQLGTYHTRITLTGEPHVAIVIPTRDRVELLRGCVESIEMLSTYRNWSLTIVDNGSARADTLDYLAATPHRVIRRPGKFNYSALINTGRAAADAPYLLTVNNDVTVVTPDWIEALLEPAQRPEVAVVGARLLYPDGRPQSEGIGVGNVRGGYMAANLDAGWMGRIVRDVSAVTGACQLVKTSVFDQLGGYDESLGVAYNDVDFCLRVRRAGMLVVYTPHAVLVHHESASRGRLDPRSDHRLFWQRWGVVGGIPDPYMNPHIRDLNPQQLRLDPLPLDH